ncbi:MAG: MFS transporter [Pseudomonadota bacterium]|jgi:AAHS family 4-hydroxybenzoate transporter-like MFS transporter
MEQPARSIWLGSLDVMAAVDQGALGAFGRRVLVLCGLIIMIDGFDVQVITYVAPVLTKALGIDRSMLGPVFSSGLVGTMLGALILAPLADRMGRKRVLCGCILLFGLCSLGTITAARIETLMAWRFLSGLGLGGATPIAVAFAAEFCPARIRATAVMIVYTGFAVGAGGGGLLAAQMIPALGWTSVFVLGGIAPLVLLAAVMLLLPDSMSDLARRGRADLLARTLGQLVPGISADPTAPIRLGEREAGFPVKRLFAEGRTPRTIMLWIMFFTNILSLYFMVSWFPTLAHASGLELSDALRAAAMIQVGSIAGTLSLALLVRRFDTFTVMSFGYLGGAIALVLAAFAGGSVGYFTAIAFLAGFFVIGTQTGANGVSALIYPASMRPTGVGWALGIGRTGSILGPSLGGMLIALDWPTRDLFVAAAVPAVVAALSAFALSRLLRRSAEVRDAVGALP